MNKLMFGKVNPAVLGVAAIVLCIAGKGVHCFVLEKQKNGKLADANLALELGLEELRRTNSSLKTRLDENFERLRLAMRSGEEARSNLNYTEYRLQQEIQRGQRLSEDLRMAEDRLQQIENERDDSRRQQEALRQNITRLENERDDSRRQQEALRQNITRLENERDDSHRQQDALRQNITRLQNGLAINAQHGNGCADDLVAWLMTIRLGDDEQLQGGNGFDKLRKVADGVALLFDSDVSFALYQARAVAASEERAQALGSMKLSLAEDRINVDPINKGDFRLLLNSKLLSQKGFVLEDKFFEFADFAWRNTPVDISDSNGAVRMFDRFTNSDLYRRIEATLNTDGNDAGSNFAGYLVRRWDSIEDSDKQLLKNIISYVETHPDVKPSIQAVAIVHDNMCVNRATEMIRTMAFTVDCDVNPDGNNIDELSKRILTVYRRSIFEGALSNLPNTDGAAFGAENRRAYRYVLSGAFGLETDEGDRRLTRYLSDVNDGKQYSVIVDSFNKNAASISIDGICKAASKTFSALDERTRTQLIEGMSRVQISYNDFCKIAVDCEDRAIQAADLEEQRLKRCNASEEDIRAAREQVITREKSRNFQTRFDEFIGNCEERDLKQELIRWKNDDTCKLSLSRLKGCVDGLNSMDANDNIPELTYLDFDASDPSNSRYISYTLYPIYLVNNHVIDIS